MSLRNKQERTERRAPCRNVQRAAALVNLSLHSLTCFGSYARERVRAGDRVS